MTKPGDIIKKDIAMLDSILGNWTTDAWQPLVDALKTHHKQVVFSGEGSSLIFPYGLFKHLKRIWNAPVSSDGLGGREAEALDLSAKTVVGISNSGETREIIELLDKLKAAGNDSLLTVVGLKDGYMPTNFEKSIAVLDDAEGAVAATASVVAQALVLGHALADVVGKEMPVEKLSNSIKEIMSSELSNEVKDIMNGTKRLFWNGCDNGASEELSLKTVEMCSIPGQFVPGSLILHGIEEILEEGDLVVTTGLVDADMGLLDKFVCKNTPAKVLRLEHALKGWAGIEYADCGEWNPVLQLVAGWRLLIGLAEILGSNPDVAERARKVGNPRV